MLTRHVHELDLIADGRDLRITFDIDADPRAIAEALRDVAERITHKLAEDEPEFITQFKETAAREEAAIERKRRTVAHLRGAIAQWEQRNGQADTVHT